MTELQVRRDDLTISRLVETAASAARIAEGEALLRIERFAFTANNITYGVVGDRMGYWQFFPAAGEDADGWGVLPVWGFAEVEQSNCDDLPEGERLFGYLPPATHLRIRPAKVSAQNVVDGTPHRRELPAGYNTYYRVAAEPGYDPANDALRMLFFPLHVTSFCLWDALREADWYGASQVIILSASSKTAIGLACGLAMDDSAPTAIGVTSERNRAFVDRLGLYASSVSYDSLTDIDASMPAVIVDMSGNEQALAALAAQLADDMRCCIRVGVTHRDAPASSDSLPRTSWFFAPSHIEQRMRDWGVDGFMQKSAAFIAKTSAQSASWLEVREIEGLDGLRTILPDVADGRIEAHEGLIVVP